MDQSIHHILWVPRSQRSQRRTGLQGKDGNDGKQGIRGKVGLQGIQGIQGEKGDAGKNGQAGSSGISAVGVKGEQGDKGEQGPQGEPGKDGTNHDPALFNALVDKVTSIEDTLGTKVGDLQAVITHVQENKDKLVDLESLSSFVNKDDFKSMENKFQNDIINNNNKIDNIIKDFDKIVSTIDTNEHKLKNMINDYKKQLENKDVVLQNDLKVQKTMNNAELKRIEAEIVKNIDTIKQENETNTTERSTIYSEQNSHINKKFDDITTLINNINSDYVNSNNEHKRNFNNNLNQLNSLANQIKDLNNNTNANTEKHTSIEEGLSTVQSKIARLFEIIAVDPVLQKKLNFQNATTENPTTEEAAQHPHQYFK